jgi:hypothetical protein
MTGTGMRRWIAVLPALVIAAATLVACSSGGGSSTTSVGASSAAPPAASGTPTSSPSGGRGGQFGAAFQAYSACLTKNGVTLPSRGAGTRPSSFPSGRTRPSSFPSGVRPSGGFRGGGGFGGGFSSVAPSGVDPSTYAKALAACASVRPSFTPGAGGAGGGNVDASAIAAYISCLNDNGAKITGTGLAALRGLNRTDATIAKALKTCAPLLPTGLGRPTATPTPS